MASLIDSLINIMNDENRQYTELLDLSNNKTTAIVKGDVGQLQEIFGRSRSLLIFLTDWRWRDSHVLQIYVRFCICQQREVKVSQIVRLLERSRQSMML